VEQPRLVANVDETKAEPIDHKEKLSSYPKEALIDEVLKTWDALAESEASVGEMLFEIKRLEVEIVKLNAVRGVSSTKVEMAERIKQLESMLRVQEKDASNNETGRLEDRVEVLLAALLDLEREVSLIKDDLVE
tara:strand:+ start:3037 stop:3438 length:402 start_codon:yes stop_codon:yes gene_type:complete